MLGVGYGRGRLKEALRGDSRDQGGEYNPIAHTHNVYLELFAETGLFGLGIFLWLFETLSGFGTARCFAPAPANARLRSRGILVRRDRDWVRSYSVSVTKTRISSLPLGGLLSIPIGRRQTPPLTLGLDGTSFPSEGSLV